MNDNIKVILDGRRIRNKLRKAGVYPMVGPRGSKGDKGDLGPQGEKEDAGAVARCNKSSIYIFKW